MVHVSSEQRSCDQAQPALRQCVGRATMSKSASVRHSLTAESRRTDHGIGTQPQLTLSRLLALAAQVNDAIILRHSARSVPASTEPFQHFSRASYWHPYAGRSQPVRLATPPSNPPYVTVSLATPRTRPALHCVWPNARPALFMAACRFKTAQRSKDGVETVPREI